MDRNMKMEIELPEEQLENFRIFIVLHGGSIVKEEKIGDNIRNNRWIPCSERLPERDVNVLAYVRNVSFDYQHVMWIDDYSGRWSGFIGSGIGDEVLAWMPLPEPYEAESEE